MSNIKIIDPLKDDSWDRFVENHPFGWICHLSGWKQVLEKSFGNMKGHNLVLLNNNEIKAALPLFEVKSWITGNRLVSIPFATLCDPLVSTADEMGELFEAVLNLSKELGISRIKIRSFASSAIIQDDRLGMHSFYKHHFLLLDESPEKLKKSFHRTSVRERIAGALKSNLSLKMAKDEVDLQTFYRLYMMTRRRRSLPPQPYIFIKALWETFSPSGMVSVLLAEHNNRTIGGLLLLKFKDRVSIEYSVSNETFWNLKPVHFLFWEAIKSACNEGYKILDFGRTSPYNETLMDFKDRWGTSVIDLPQYFYPKEAGKSNGSCEDSMGYETIKKICKKAPDFALPQIGRLCYKHLG